MIKDLSDLQIQGGAAHGTSTATELRAKAQLPILEEQTSISTTANKLLNTLKFHLESISDLNSEVKYASSTDVAYFGNGAFSVLPGVGEFIFQKATVEPATAAFGFSDKEGTLKSTAPSTILGTTNIYTTDGKQTNPISVYYPSTTFSPNRTWVEVLFPLNFENLSLIVMAELIQVALVKLLAGLNNKTSDTETKESKSIETLIVDNQQLQDDILLNATI